MTFYSGKCQNIGKAEGDDEPPCMRHRALATTSLWSPLLCGCPTCFLGGLFPTEVFLRSQTDHLFH